jgi:hypothetical protein
MCNIYALKFSQAISRVSVRLNTKVSETRSVSAMKVDPDDGDRASLTRENCIAFICHEGFKSYTITFMLSSIM